MAKKTVLLLLLLAASCHHARAEVAGSAAGVASKQDDADACPSKCRCTRSEIVCRNVGLDEIPEDLPTGSTKYTKM